MVDRRARVVVSLQEDESVMSHGGHVITTFTTMTTVKVNLTNYNDSATNSAGAASSNNIIGVACVRHLPSSRNVALIGSVITG